MVKRLVSLENLPDDALIAALSIRKEEIPSELTGMYHALLGLYSNEFRIEEAANAVPTRVSTRSIIRELRLRRKRH